MPSVQMAIALPLLAVLLMPLRKGKPHDERPRVRGGDVTDNASCHVCGWRVTQQWLEHVADVARYAIPVGAKLHGVVVRCEECRPVVVVHHTFVPGVDFWKAS